MNQVPENVIDDYVTFLDAMNAVGFDYEAVVQSDLGHLAARHSGEADGRYTELFCFRKRFHEVVGVPAGRESDEAIAGARLCDQLADKDMLEADVVRHRAHHRSIRGQIDRSQRDAPGRHRMQKLNRHVRCIAARATVAHREEPSVMTINVRNRAGSSNDSLPILRKKLVDHLLMMSCLLRH